MRRYHTKAEMNFIPDVGYKKQCIANNYVQYCDYTSPQGYFMEQLRLNPKLLAWIFEDNSLEGRSYLDLDPERYEAFQDFYDSFDVFAE